MIWEPYTYVMADDALLASETGSSLVREETCKHSDAPLFDLTRTDLTCGRPAVSLVTDLVVREGGTTRIWYQVRGIRAGQADHEAMCKAAWIGYAESEDGIHFHPVTLNQVEFNGSRANNLVSFPGGGEAATRVSGLFHDPLDREYPWKCVYYRPGKGADLDPGILSGHPHLGRRDWWFVWGIGRSRDGLSWEPPRHAHTLIAANPEHAKLHRAIDGSLVIADQMTSGFGTWSHRNVRGWITRDLVTAAMIPDHLYSVPQHVARHHHEYGGSHEWNGTPWIQPHVGLVCGRKGSCILGLNGFLYGATGAETFAQVAETGLCVSDTGIYFRDVWPYQPFIRRGLRGAWDFGMAAQTALIDTPTETRCYYAGGDVGNFASTYLPGLAWIERDRYAFRLIRGQRHITPEPMQASLELKPVTLPERPLLELNVTHVDASRTIRVEVADGAGQPLPGFGFDDCLPVTQPGLRVPVSWKDTSIAALSGQTVRLRFRLASASCGLVYHDSPRLYAFYLATPPD